MKNKTIISIALISAMLIVVFANTATANALLSPDSDICWEDLNPIMKKVARPAMNNNGIAEIAQIERITELKLADKATITESAKLDVVNSGALGSIIDRTINTGLANKADIVRSSQDPIMP